MDYMLCKEFGWTINELNEQPGNTVVRFIQIMQQRNTQEKIKGQTNGGH